MPTRTFSLIISLHLRAFTLSQKYIMLTIWPWNSKVKIHVNLFVILSKLCFTKSKDCYEISVFKSFSKFKTFGGFFYFWKVRRKLNIALKITQICWVLGELGEVSFGVLNLDELGEVSFRMLSKLGYVRFGMHKFCS